MTTRAARVPAAAPVPLAEPRKKRRMTAEDDLVVECKRRAGAGGGSWAVDLREAVTFLQDDRAAGHRSRKLRRTLSV